MRQCPRCSIIADDAVSYCPHDGTRLDDLPGPASPDEELVGQEVGHYRVTALLGAGGMGAVYLGIHPTIGSRVAIKVLHREMARDRGAVRRFFAEARAVNLIRHENIINILDLAELPDGRSYIVMEYLEGESLGARVRGRGPLDQADAIRVMLSLLAGLQAAHDHGVLHRDLKPDNVFLTGGGQVKLLDFGIAKLEILTGESSLTSTGAILGTPMYMSPEQATGHTAEVDRRADIYSAGVILYEMLTGRVPFKANTLIQLVSMIALEPAPPVRGVRPEVSAELEDVAMRALAKEPSARFQSAAEMAGALRRALGPLEQKRVAAAPPRPAATMPGPGAPAALAATALAPPAISASGTGAPPPVTVPPTAPQHVPLVASSGGAPGEVAWAVAPAAVAPPAPAASASSEPSVAAGSAASLLPGEAVALSLGGRRGVLVAVIVASVVAAAGAAWWLLSARGRAADAAAAAGQRQLFEASLMAAHEPRAPAACRTANRATLEALAEAAGRLSGGAPRSARPQDLEAVTRLEAAREAAGSSAEYWYLLGRALLFAGRESASVEEVAQKALEACPEFAAAHNLTGTAEFVSGRDKEALGHYERAAALDRSYVTPRVNRALVLLRQKRVQQALNDLEVIVREAPGHPDALLVRGQALLLDGATAKAIPDLEAAVRGSPGNAAAHLLLGEAYSRAERHDEARAAFCRAKSLGNRNAAARCVDDGGPEPAGVTP